MKLACDYDLFKDIPQNLKEDDYCLLTVSLYWTFELMFILFWDSLIPIISFKDQFRNLNNFH